LISLSFLKKFLSFFSTLLFLFIYFGCIVRHTHCWIKQNNIIIILFFYSKQQCKEKKFLSTQKHFFVKVASRWVIKFFFIYLYTHSFILIFFCFCVHEFTSFLRSALQSGEIKNNLYEHLFLDMWIGSAFYGQN